MRFRGLFFGAWLVLAAAAGVIGWARDERRLDTDGAEAAARHYYGLGSGDAVRCRPIDDAVFEREVYDYVCVVRRRASGRRWSEEHAIVVDDEGVVAGTHG